MLTISNNTGDYSPEGQLVPTRGRFIHSSSPTSNFINPTINPYGFHSTIKLQANQSQGQLLSSQIRIKVSRGANFRGAGGVINFIGGHNQQQPLEEVKEAVLVGHSRGYIDSDRSLSMGKRASLPGQLVMNSSKSNIVTISNTFRRRTGSSLRRDSVGMNTSNAIQSKSSHSA